MNFFNDLTICCSQSIHLKYDDISRLKVKPWKMIYHTNINEKKDKVIILI